MFKLFNAFPRECATPYRSFCSNWKEFLNFANCNNTKNSCYTSVYRCDENRQYDNSIIDKVFFDFDGENAYSEMLKLHVYLMQKQLMHQIIFSGGGLHLYLFIKPMVFNNNKTSLAQLHHYFIKETNIDVDKHIIGDIARITRIPCTWNCKRRRYCIPITEEDINKGYEFIKDKAATQHWEFNIYGNIEFAATEFNHYQIEISNNIEIPEFTGELSTDEVLKDLPVCAQKWFLNEEINNQQSGTWEARYFAMLMLRDLGYPKSVANSIAKKYFECIIRTDEIRNNYEHFKKTKVLEYAYSNRIEFVPSCNSLIKKGLCPGRCNKYNRDSSPKGFYKEMECEQQ